MLLQATISILDALVPLQETTELERAEIDIPDTIVDLFETVILARTDDGEIHPIVVPADATIRTVIRGTDEE